MVKGIGIDIIEIERVRSSIETLGDAFLQRVYTEGEIAYCTAKQNRYQHFAARFAAKEAVSKALATGWAGDFSWRDTEVINTPGGQPQVVLHGAMRDRLAACRVHLSLSHSATHVVAVAVIDVASTGNPS
jgi:holo-[acyl-carrier protein] synthase